MEFGVMGYAPALQEFAVNRECCDKVQNMEWGDVV